jgi:hypothetical protein
MSIDPRKRSRLHLLHHQRPRSTLANCRVVHQIEAVLSASHDSPFWLPRDEARHERIPCDACGVFIGCLLYQPWCFGSTAAFSFRVSSVCFILFICPFISLCHEIWIAMVGESVYLGVKISLCHSLVSRLRGTYHDMILTNIPIACMCIIQWTGSLLDPSASCRVTRLLRKDTLVN